MMIWHKVLTAVKAKDRGAFDRLLTNRSKSIDALRDWLSARGYAISRSAVGRYVKAQREREGDDVRLRRIVRGANDEQLRDRGRELLNRLDGEHLVAAVLGIGVAALAKGRLPEGWLKGL